MGGHTVFEKGQVRRFVLVVGSIGLGLLAPLLVLEILLRFLPVDRGLRPLPVDAANPIRRFTPNRTSTFSRSWNFTQANTVRSNNYGFINNQDYDPAATPPLLAVVGDSYVEAVMVPYFQTGAGILAADLGARGRVYTFAASGSPLSQYLAYAEYARRTFRPSALVVVIIANDYDESFRKYRGMPGFHYFEEGPGGLLALHRLDHQLPLSTRLLRDSALGMYLMLNLRGAHYLDTWRRASQPAGASSTSGAADPTRVADGMRAIDAFLRLLPEMAGLQSPDILFAVDGIRPAVYKSGDGADADPYAHHMRQYFMAHAGAAGLEVVDLHAEFTRHFRRHGQRFEFERDAHWNGVGHEVFASAVKRSALYSRLRIMPSSGEAR